MNIFFPHRIQRIELSFYPFLLWKSIPFPPFEQVEGDIKKIFEKSEVKHVLSEPSVPTRNTHEMWRARSDEGFHLLKRNSGNPVLDSALDS